MSHFLKPHLTKYRKPLRILTNLPINESSTKLLANSEALSLISNIFDGGSDFLSERGEVQYTLRSHQTDSIVQWRSRFTGMGTILCSENLTRPPLLLLSWLRSNAVRLASEAEISLVPHLNGHLSEVLSGS